MRAFVSDQSSSFNSVVIGTAPNSTVVASLKLPPGSWVVFAHGSVGCGHQRFSGCAHHHGTSARHADNSAGRVRGDSEEHGLVSADDDYRHRGGIGDPHHLALG